MPNHVHLIVVPADEDWRWSSVRAHLYGREDGLTTPGPVRERFAPFRAFLAEPPDPGAIARLRAAESIGRPVASKAFHAGLERRSGRTLRPAKRGPKPRRHDRARARSI